MTTITVDMGGGFRPSGAELPALRARRSARRNRQPLEAALLEVIVEPPARHLLHDLVEFAVRQLLVDEPLAAAELAEVPCAIGEFGRDRALPQRQVFPQVGVDCLL